MSGGTNSKIKQQNKQIEKQYEYDKDVYDYNRKEDQRKYEDAVAKTQLNQINQDNQAAYRDAINLQAYEYDTDIQQYQFDLQNQAYERALDDYDSQVELNSMAGALAQEGLDRKLDEALISKNFQLGDLELGYQKDQSDAAFAIDKNIRDVEFAEQKLALDKDPSGFQFIQDQAQRDLDKSLLSDQKIDLNSASIAANAQNQIDQSLLRDQQTNLDIGLIGRQADRDLATNAAQRKKIQNQIGTALDQAGFNQEKINLKFSREKTDNYNQRIQSLVQNKRNVGSVRAAGRSGVSAQASVNSALAEYGRNQANFVDSMVFSKKDRDIATRENMTMTNRTIAGLRQDQTINRIQAGSIRDKASTDIASKGIDLSISARGRANTTTQKNISLAGNQVDKALNEVNREDIVGKRDRDLFLKELQNNKLDLAFTQFATDKLADTEKIKKDLGFKDEEYANNIAKIETTFDSAQLQYEADTAKNQLDEYAANLAAQGKVPNKPIAPPPIPVPIETPRTILPLPLAPTKPPEPIKGVLGKTSIWNDIGDAANVGLQIAGLFI